MEPSEPPRQGLQRSSFSGIQYSSTGQTLLLIIDRSKQYFIAYAIDKGDRKQLLTFQFEFNGDDKDNNPFSRVQPVIIDGKLCGEDSLIGILTQRFNSRQIGIHLIDTYDSNQRHMKIALRHHFFHLLPPHHWIYTKAGNSYLGAENVVQDGDVLPVSITANGPVVVLLGHERLLEQGAEWMREEIK